MKQRRIAFGPGASSLILIVVVLCMSMLAMLTVVSARNDEKLGKRSTAMTEDIYTLNTMAEESLAELDALIVSVRENAASPEAFLEEMRLVLPEGMVLEGNLVFWEEKSALRVLKCAVRLAEADENARYEWVSHHLITDESGVIFDD